MALELYRRKERVYADCSIPEKSKRRVLRDIVEFFVPKRHRRWTRRFQKLTLKFGMDEKGAIRRVAWEEKKNPALVGRVIRRILLLQEYI